MGKSVFDKSVLPWRLGLVVGISCLSVIGLFFLTGAGNSLPLLSQLDPFWLLLAFLLMFLVWGLDGLTFWFLFRGIGEPIPFLKLFLVNLVATFASNITPFYAGGPPTFIYLLSREGIRVGKTASVITARIVITVLVFSLIIPLFLLILGAKLSLDQVWRTIFSIPIFLVAFAVSLIYLYTRKSRVPNAYFRRIQSWPLPFLLRNPRIRRIWRWSLVESKKMRQAIEQLLSFGWKNIFLTALSSALYWFTFLMVAPFILYSLKVENFILLQTLLNQAILNLLLPFAPTPGASGAAEFGFASLFLNIVPQSLLGIFAAIWRLFTYHLTILAGGLALIFLLRNWKLPWKKLASPE